MGALCLSLFCYQPLCVHSSFAIILKRKRKLVAYRCIVTITIMLLFLTVLWIGLQCVIVVIPGHTRLFFGLNDLYSFDIWYVVSTSRSLPCLF